MRGKAEGVEEKKEVKTMASFALSATMGGARKHAWTKRINCAFAYCHKRNHFVTGSAEYNIKFRFYMNFLLYKVF